MGSDPVFVVDGDPAVRDSLSTLLDLNGYEVKSCSTGAAFLNQLRTETKPTCVVCEAELPDTSGIEIYRKVQELDRDLPFALLVSRRNPSVIQSARESGIDQIFLKPLVHRHLIEFISRQADREPGTQRHFRR
jgi:FixJ family two-component response regulator